MLDPLFATVLVLDDGAHRLVLIALDLCILETEVAGRIRARLAPLAGTPPAHIVLACSHTHSGPYPWDPAWPGEPIENVGPGILGPSSAAYFAQLSDALAAAVGAAVTDLAPARLRSAETDLPHAYNRRVRLPGGGVGHAWDARVWTGPAPAPASSATSPKTSAACSPRCFRRAMGPTTGGRALRFNQALNPEPATPRSPRNPPASSCRLSLRDRPRFP